MSVKAIRKYLDYPDAVIFVGSGISRWSGLPSWEGLIDQLAEYLEDEGKDATLVRREADAGDLLQAASYGFDKLGPQSIGDFIRKAVRLGAAKPHEIHRLIVTLGPSCFITTNYDNLIEQALSAWRSDEFYRPAITNLHLADLAEILSARASHFIFKPHGDASTSESVILTREQYRVLLPDGERHRSLEALKTLLVTRPVIYFGFGLRDPDFLYIKDILLNTFKGSTREHIAILANIADHEIDYWSRNYGIRLFSYNAPVADDGKEDHSALIELLENLSSKYIDNQDLEVELAEQPISDEKRVLALARYTSGLSRNFSEFDPVETRISAHGLQRQNLQIMPPPYEHWTTARFLMEGPPQSILIGLPGAGKSFALRMATANLAKDVQDFLLGDMRGAVPTYVPVFIDLKLFHGDLRAQISAAMPSGFDARSLRGQLRLKIFFDAYNEIPAEYVESGAFLDELGSLADEIGDFEYVISSRTTDGLAPLSLPTYELSQFDPDHVDKILSDRGISLTGNFQDDVKRLLSRPFFLGLLMSGSVDIADACRPKDIYASYISRLDADWIIRSSSTSGLSTALSRLAFRAMDDGREAFPISWVTDHLAQTEADGDKSSQPDALNWLIARGVLIPYSGARVSFIHQSITEYLAAIELVRMNDARELSLRDTVSLKKWDQCLFLAISLMDEKEADKAISYLLQADLKLALNAVRFAEDGQSDLISRIMPVVVDRARSTRNDYGVAYALSRVPMAEDHVPALEQIVAAGGAWATQGLKGIARVQGLRRKDYFFGLLEANPYDYDFVANGLVGILEPWIEPSDLTRLVALAVAPAKLIDSEPETPRIGSLLVKFDPDNLVVEMEAQVGAALPIHVKKVLCDTFRESESERSFELLLKMIVELVPEAVYALYARTAYGEGERYIHHFTLDHVHSIWEMRINAQFWDSLLKIICKNRPELRDHLRDMASDLSGIERISLLSAIEADPTILRDELRLLSAQPDQYLASENFEIFSLNKLDWSGLEAEFAALIARGIPKLAKAVLGGSLPCDIKGLGRLSRSEIEPAIRWASDLPTDTDVFWWIRMQIGSVVARHSDTDARQYLLDTIENGISSHRIFIKRCAITYMYDLNTDILGEETLSFLMSDLAKANSLDVHFYNPLGQLATERFVEERLIPLAKGADVDLMNNLRIVLEAAGDRHGRRYLLSIGG